MKKMIILISGKTGFSVNSTIKVTKKARIIITNFGS